MFARTRTPGPASLAICLEINSHQFIFRFGACCVPNQRVARNNFHIARIFPHLEIELHSVISEGAYTFLRKERSS